MADLVIRGMEMPKDGRITIQIGADGAVYFVEKCTIIAEKYEKNSHVIPLPEGHGKLGDLDKIVSFIDYYERPMDRDTSPLKALSAVRDYICNDSNTIIPADGGM